MPLRWKGPPGSIVPCSPASDWIWFQIRAIAARIAIHGVPDCVHAVLSFVPDSAYAVPGRRGRYVLEVAGLGEETKFEWSSFIIDDADKGQFVDIVAMGTRRAMRDLMERACRRAGERVLHDPEVRDLLTATKERRRFGR